MTDALALLRKYYPQDSAIFRILIDHSHAVARMAMRIACRLRTGGFTVDTSFVEEAALLHDIGIFATRAAAIGCHGDRPYICHGLTGREVLESEGLPRHALVCERHIGVGLSVHDIKEQRLPLPHRDMRPLSIEEEIVTYADLFFSKKPHARAEARTTEQVREKLLRRGSAKAAVFDGWHERFGV